MSDEEDEQHIFVCPECEEYLEVNTSMKNALVERGCVICGTSVTEEAFSEDSFADSA